MKYSFPAIFYEDENEPGFIVISFPDLIGVGSECEKGKEIETAKEVLELVLSSSPFRRLTNPTDIKYIKKYNPKCRVELIEVEVD